MKFSNSKFSKFLLSVFLSKQQFQKKTKTTNSCNMFFQQQKKTTNFLTKWQHLFSLRFFLFFFLYFFLYKNFWRCKPTWTTFLRFRSMMFFSGRDTPGDEIGAHHFWIPPEKTSITSVWLDLKDYYDSYMDVIEVFSEGNPKVMGSYFVPRCVSSRKNIMLRNLRNVVQVRIHHQKFLLRKK